MSTQSNNQSTNQGGSHEQHVRSGEQSHKNKSDSSSQSQSAGGAGGKQGSASVNPEKQEGGRHSHDNK